LAFKTDGVVFISTLKPWAMVRGPGSHIGGESRFAQAADDRVEPGVEELSLERVLIEEHRIAEGLVVPEEATTPATALM
jgi:hypothetical protein